MIDIDPIHGSFLEADPNDPQYAEVFDCVNISAFFEFFFLKKR